MIDEPVILSAEDAQTIVDALNGYRALAFRDTKCPEFQIPKLNAIATEKTIVTRKLAEAQCREAAVRNQPAHVSDSSDFQTGYLACARALGAIVEDGT